MSICLGVSLQGNNFKAREYTQRAEKIKKQVITALWHKPAKNKRHFLSRVPYGDPYREERDFTNYLGGDLRVVYISKDDNQYLVLVVRFVTAVVNSGS